MPVTGIGGFFFRSRDTRALADWYLTHLGVGAPETSGSGTSRQGRPSSRRSRKTATISPPIIAGC